MVLDRLPERIEEVGSAYVVRHGRSELGRSRIETSFAPRKALSGWSLPPPRGSADRNMWALAKHTGLGRRSGLLYVNPGSAGRRRFKLRIALASLEVTPEGLKPMIHDLEI